MVASPSARLLRCGVEFLSPEWSAALAEVAAGAVVAEGARLTLAVVVTGPDAEDIRWVIDLADGAVAVRAGVGDEAAADVTFTVDRATAAAMSRGQLGAQDAFMAGRLRIGGDLSTLLASAEALGALGDLFASVRDRTTW